MFIILRFIPNTILIINIYGGWKRLRNIHINIGLSMWCVPASLSSLQYFDKVVGGIMDSFKGFLLPISLWREKRQTHTRVARKYSFFGLYYSFQNHMKSPTLLKKYNPPKTINLSSKMEKMNLRKLFAPRSNFIWL